MRRIKSRVFLVLSVFLPVMLMTAGCGILEELVGKDPAAAGLAQLVSALTQSEPVISESAEGQGGRKQTVTLYFTDGEGRSLLPETREMPHTLSVGRETVRQWLLGPGENSALRRTVSAAATLRDINISDGVATIDLSSGFLELNEGVQAQTALYSLVNTVCQFSTVHEVVLYVDGKLLTSYHGILTGKLQWKEDLVVLTDAGVRVDTDAGPDTGTGDEDLSPSSINIFQ
jgi:germination protein M